MSFPTLLSNALGLGVRRKALGENAKNTAQKPFWAAFGLKANPFHPNFISHPARCPTYSPFPILMT